MINLAQAIVNVLSLFGVLDALRDVIIAMLALNLLSFFLKRL